MVKPLELATLKHLTRAALAKTRKELLRDCNFEPFAQMIHDDGVANVPFQGEWMESGRKKDVLFALFGEICRRTEALGLIIVTDGWALEHTPEQLKRFENDPEYIRAFGELTLKGLPEAAAAGFGRLVETIVCQGQTRQHTYGLMQHYERVAKDGVIPGTAVRSGHALGDHKIRFRGDPHILSTEQGGAPSGRMFTLFEGNDEPVPPEVEAYIKKLFGEVPEWTRRRAERRR
jgi:hypothetical protein